MILNTIITIFIITISLHIQKSGILNACGISKIDDEAFGNPVIARTVYSDIFRHIQWHSAIFSHFQVYLETLRYINTYSGIIEAYWSIFRNIKTQCNLCIYNHAIFRTLEHLEPDTFSNFCQTIKMIRHFQSSDINQNSCFKHLQRYLGILMHIQPYSQACNWEGGAGISPASFWKSK